MNCSIASSSDPNTLMHARHVRLKHTGARAAKLVFPGAQHSTRVHCAAHMHTLLSRKSSNMGNFGETLKSFTEPQKTARAPMGRAGAQPPQVLPLLLPADHSH